MKVLLEELLVLAKQLAHQRRTASQTVRSAGVAWMMHTSCIHQENAMKTTARWLVLALPVVSAACFGASHPPPTDHLATAIAAVHGAQVAGAANVPQASLHLKLAEEQVAQAREMMKRGDNERADYMTLRAFNDAQLAVALSREHELRLRAESAAKSSTEAERNAPPPPAQ